MAAPSPGALALFQARRQPQPAAATATPAVQQPLSAPTYDTYGGRDAFNARLWENQQSLDLAKAPIFRASDIKFYDPRTAPVEYETPSESNSGVGRALPQNSYARWEISNPNIRTDTYQFLDPRGFINYSDPSARGYSDGNVSTDNPSGTWTEDPAKIAALDSQLNALGGAAPESFAFGIKSGGQHGKYSAYRPVEIDGETYYVPTQDLGFHGGEGSGMDTNENQRSMNKWLVNTALTAATYGLSDAAGAGMTAASAAGSTANTAMEVARQALNAYRMGQGGYNAYQAAKRGDWLGAVSGGAGALGGLAATGALGDLGRAVGQGSRIVGSTAGLTRGILNKDLLASIGSGLGLAGASGAVDSSTASTLGALQQLTQFAGQGRRLTAAPRTINIRRPVRPGG